MSTNIPVPDTTSDEAATPVPSLPVGARRAWEAHGGGVFIPSSNLSRLPRLPPAIYSFVMTQNGWYLSQTAPSFAFPFRLYDTHEAIVERVLARFASTSGNTGALFNGEKGAGKTVAVQLIANRCIEQGIPVLVVADPIPLAAVLATIEQDVVIVFDEFEKTHKKPEDQTAILSTVDGMGRTAHRRLFMFTTNATSIDPNFVDRPSRVAYIFEFGRLSDVLVAQIVDTELDPSRRSLRNDLLVYLADRKTLTIDVTRAAVREVNLFGLDGINSAFNASEFERSYFDVLLLDPRGNVVRPLARTMQPREADARYLRRAIAAAATGAEVPNCYVRSDTFTIEILDAVVLPDGSRALACYVNGANAETWRKDYRKVFDLDDSCAFDMRPEGWTVPSWVIRTQEGGRLTKEQKEQKDAFDNDFCHGTGVRARLLLRFEPVRFKQTYNALAF